jgi:hypothetical protein
VSTDRQSTELVNVAFYSTSRRRTERGLPTISERLNIFYRQVLDKRAPSSSPAIAVYAADKPLLVTINLNHWFVAALTLHISDSSV